MVVFWIVFSVLSALCLGFVLASGPRWANTPRRADLDLRHLGGDR